MTLLSKQTNKKSTCTPPSSLCVCLSAVTLMWWPGQICASQRQFLLHNNKLRAKQLGFNTSTLKVGLIRVVVNIYPSPSPRAPVALFGQRPASNAKILLVSNVSQNSPIEDGKTFLSESFETYFSWSEKYWRNWDIKFCQELKLKQTNISHTPYPYPYPYHS